LENDSNRAGLYDSEKNVTDTNREQDKDSAAASGSQVHILSRPQDTWNSGGAHPFTGGPSGLRIQEAPHVNKDSTPLSSSSWK